MEELKFLFKKMAKIEPLMFLLIALYALFAGVKPFLWIISPAFILKNYAQNPQLLIVFFIGLFLISSFIGFFDSFVMGNYRMRMNNIRYRLINMVTSYALYLPYAKKKEKEESEKINNAKEAVRYPFMGAGGLMMNFPQIFAFIFSIGGFIWVFSRMSLIVVISTVILTIISTVIAYKVPKVYDNYWQSMSPNWNKFTKINEEIKSPLSKQDILIYDTINIFKSYYFKTNKDRIKALKVTNNKVLSIFSLSKLVSLIRDLIIVYWLMTSLIKGVIDIADFYVYFTAIFAFVEFNTQCMWLFSDFTTSLSRFKPFFKIVDVYENNKKEIYPNKLEIKLENVSFSYPNTNTYVLKNINMTIKNRESIALVGENGAGKTSLALILAGFYEPSEGRILINGRDKKDLDLDYNKLVAAVFQDSSILPFSIKENILLSDEDRNLDYLYKMTDFNKLINSFDKKDKQILLRILDNDGVDLSGGQKQRLFLLRALAKEKSKLLILDEPTAQLDALNEKDLYKLYNKYTKDKSSIFISHRLASTRFCDRIVYLKDGEIKSTGSHEELMKKDLDYKDLYNLQAKNYREAI